MRVGIELSTDTARFLGNGAIIETCEEKLIGKLIIRVRLKDGSGWTTACTTDGMKFLEEMDAAETAAAKSTPEYKFLETASAGNAFELHALVVRHPTIITSQVCLNMIAKLQ